MIGRCGFTCKGFVVTSSLIFASIVNPTSSTAQVDGKGGADAKASSKHKHQAHHKVKASAVVDTKLVSSDIADAKSNQVLSNLSEFYKSLKSFQTRLIQTMEASAGARKIDLSTVTDIYLKRPNLISIQFRAGLPGGNLMSDGTNAYYYSQILNRYAVIKAPDDFEKLFIDPNTSNSRIVNGAYNMYSLLPSLVSKDRYISIFAGVRKAEYVGVENVYDTSCHHIRFTQDQFAWDLWVEDSDTPWVVKVSPSLFPDLTEPIGRPQIHTTHANAKLALLFQYKNSIADPHLKEKLFSFEPPPESKEIPTLMPETSELPKPESSDSDSK